MALLNKLHVILNYKICVTCMHTHSTWIIYCLENIIRIRCYLILLLWN